MVRVGFEPTIPVLGRSKTVRDLDSVANVINKTDLFSFFEPINCPCGLSHVNHRN
jgi:hypothetical protein